MTREFDWVLHQQERQFFERKSCYDRSSGRVRRRSPSDVAKDIAETLAAMANTGGFTEEELDCIQIPQGAGDLTGRRRMSELRI
jgi:hypothetical protein